jgi:mannose-1-phosphate guanylyltransferase
MSGSKYERFAVIMAGGSGTRFWPLSRRVRPKQLLAIVNRRSLLQETVARMRGLVATERVVVVTGREHAAAVRRQLPELAADNILVEPVGRNTAPCIALAAEWIHRRAPGSVMAVMPSDHAIRDIKAFRRTLRRAFAVAEREEALVTLGVRPTHPDTGYGYINAGADIDERAPCVFRVARFREKPPATVAKRYVASGRYLWNAGIFVWRTAVIRAALERHLPRVAAPLRQAALGGRRLRLPLSLYRVLPSVSIDVGVMEPAAARRGPPAVVVIACDFGWSDVGNWAALGPVWGRDRKGNASRGRTTLLDSSGMTVYAGTRLVAGLGVHDLIIVDTPDAVLVCPASRAQDVRLVVAELARRYGESFV